MDREGALRHLQAAAATGLIAVDTETTGLRVKDGTDYCIGVSLAYYLDDFGFMSCYFPFRHPENNLDPDLISILSDVLHDCNLIFFNRKFDLHSLDTLGITLAGSKSTHYDCMMLAHMINEEYPYEKSLDACGKAYCDEGKYDKDRIKTWGKLWGFGNIPMDLLSPYACQDAELTYKLYTVLYPKWLAEFDVELWWWEQQWNDVLYRLEKRGVYVDLEFCRVKAEIGWGILSDIEDRLGFNPSSNVELSKFLLEELGMPVLERSAKTGKPSYNKHVMEEYEEMLTVTKDPSATLILEHRGWKKAVTALYDPIQRVVSPDGRVRANYKQHGTKTSRLSCSSPNLQQLPRSSSKPWNGNARSAFSSGRDSHTLVSFDYSQLELRLAACYGNEAILLEEFAKENADPFTRYAQILEEDRQTTKTFFYANIYESGAAKIAYTLNRAIEQVEILHKRFKESIPGIQHASVQARKVAASRKYVKLWTGRRRHYYSKDSKYYTAFNSVLQGGGAEVVKRSMVNLQPIENDECFMLMQIHDEVVFSIRTDLIDKYVKIIVPIMENHPIFPIKLKVEHKLWK